MTLLPTEGLLPFEGLLPGMNLTDDASSDGGGETAVHDAIGYSRPDLPGLYVRWTGWGGGAA